MKRSQRGNAIGNRYTLKPAFLNQLDDCQNISVVIYDQNGVVFHPITSVVVC
jgi:hypothetical protein